MYDVIRRLLVDIPRRDILYINFESEYLTGLKGTDLDDLVSVFFELSNPSVNLPVYLFLDEIQVVENWSRWVNRMYESKNTEFLSLGPPLSSSHVSLLLNCVVEHLILRFFPSAFMSFFILSH